MGKLTEAQRSLRHGAKFPYDASDKWWLSSGGRPPRTRDWAHRAARGILADLRDRRAIKRGFENVDEGTRKEIVDSLSEIIREAGRAALASTDGRGG